jgi:hypothetical protein
MKEMLENCKQ